MQSQLIEDLDLENSSSDQKKQQIISYIQRFAEKMKNIEEKLIDYIDQKEDQEIKYQILTDYLTDIYIHKNKEDLKLFFHLIVQMSNHYFRCKDFFVKINKILTEFQTYMVQYFSNYEIFNIFKSNMKILLYLFESKIILPDQAILSIICSNKYKEKKYPKFFFQEIKSLVNEQLYQEYCFEEDLDIFEIKREIGENDSLICEFIRKDSVVDFISYVNSTNYSLNNNIDESIFETNDFLINKTPSLIEYATFYGSIQIFRYLINNNVKMTPSLWLFAIHGRNPDIIHLLEENHVKPNDDSFKECLIESIKCHHNELTNYIENNLLTVNKEHLNIFSKCLKYYNFMDFSMISTDNYNDLLLYSIKYDFIPFVELFNKTFKLNPNTKIIYQSKYIIKEDSPLNIAVRKGNIEILQKLLSMNNVDVNNKYVRTDKKYTEKEKYQSSYETIIETTEEKAPIIIAVEKGNFEIVKLLASQPKSDIDSISVFQRLEYDSLDNKINERSKKTHKEYRNALIISIENNFYDIFQFLLSKNILTQYKYSQIDSRFRGYLDNGSCELIKYYEEYEEKNILIIAIEKGASNIVQQLLTIKEIDPNSKHIKLSTFSGSEKDYQEKTALIIAIEKENIEIIRLLVSIKKINVNSLHINRYDSGKYIEENNALIIATMTQNPEIVQLLLSRKDIDINAKYFLKSPKIEHCLDFTSYFGEQEVKKERTALFTAVELENEKIVQLLLSIPETNVNSKLIHIQFQDYIDKNKYYAYQTEYKSEFFAAVEKRNVSIVQLFMQRKDVDVNFISTLMSDTRIYRYSETQISRMETYLKFEKKIEKKTVLHIAVQNCDTNITQLLLTDPKIDVNTKYSMQKDQTYIQTKKEKKKTFEQTPLHIAIEKQNVDIVQLLLSMSDIDVNAKQIKNSNLYESPIIKTPLIISEENKNVIIMNLLKMHCKNFKRKRRSK